MSIPKQAQPLKSPRWPLRVLDERRQALLQMPLDVDLSGSTPFRHTRHMYVPKKGGVYLVHDLRGVLYVGKSRNLYRRFNEHYWLTDNELLSLAMRQSFGEITFSWVIANEEWKQAELEHNLIAWLRPVCNRLLPGASKQS